MNENGVLQRDNQGPSLFRVRRQKYPLLVAVATLGIVAFLTNPANDIDLKLSTMFPSSFNRNVNNPGKKKSSYPKRNKLGTINLSWLGFEMDFYESSMIENLRKKSTKIEKMTNFLFFSLSARPRDGVYIHALQNDWKLCIFDELDEFRMCETIADNFCHEMKFLSARYRPFTAYRIIIYNLILNTFLHAFFVVKVYSYWTILISPIPPVLQDYIYSTFYIYPFLEILDKVILKGYSHVTDRGVISIFYYAHVACFFFIGKLCELLIQRIIYDRRSTQGNGRIGTYAAALGYQMTFQNQLQKKFIFRLWQVNMEFDASSILLGHTVMAIFSILGGMNDGSDAFGELLIWIFGALVGKGLGNVHTDYYGGRWWSWL